jgi:hypothetical protein
MRFADIVQHFSALLGRLSGFQLLPKQPLLEPSPIAKYLEKKKQRSVSFLLNALPIGSSQAGLGKLETTEVSDDRWFFRDERCKFDESTSHMCPAHTANSNRHTRPLYQPVEMQHATAGSPDIPIQLDTNRLPSVEYFHLYGRLPCPPT